VISKEAPVSADEEDYSSGDSDDSHLSSDSDGKDAKVSEK